METCFWAPRDAWAEASHHGAPGVVGRAIIVQVTIKAAIPSKQRWSQLMSGRAELLEPREDSELVGAGLLDVL